MESAFSDITARVDSRLWGYRQYPTCIFYTRIKSNPVVVVLAIL